MHQKECLHGTPEPYCKYCHKGVFRCVHGLSKDCEACALKIKLSQIETRLMFIEETLDRITKEDLRAYQEPYKCPVCVGHGYYDFGTEGLRSNFKCRSCDGKGIVWNQN